MYSYDVLYQNALALLQGLISIPSFSREEDKTAQLIKNFLNEHKVAVKQEGYNVYASNKFFDAHKPTLLLNSHHDTVKPNRGYTREPFTASVEDGKLFGLGSNDAGGCLVSLIATFLFYYERNDLPFNIILAASAEEEV
ncbi:MAG: M20/M25/M40 family metallo-hydrolase, partial [Bacteroidetes bacterium]